MPRITYCVFCKGVKLEPNEKDPCLLGLVHILSPKYIPGQFSFAIAFGIMGVDVLKDNQFRVIFSSPSGEEVSKVETLTTPLPPEKVTLDPEFTGYQIAIALTNVDIKESGMHSLKIYMNNDLIDTKTIPVIKEGNARFGN